MNKKVRLGIFFVFTLSLLVFSIITFGKIKMLGKGYDLFIDYVFIGDLRVNGKVAYRGGGIVIGFVRNIDINADGTIRVTAFITNEKVILPEGTKFTIQTVGLGLGEKYVMATPPSINTLGERSIMANSIVKGTDPVSLESALGSLGDIKTELNLQDLNNIIEDLVNVVSVLNDIVVTNGNQISEIFVNANSAVKNINTLALKLNSIVDDVQSGKGVLGGAIKDEALYRDLKLTVANLKDFSEKVKDNPSSLLFREKDIKK